MFRSWSISAASLKQQLMFWPTQIHSRGPVQSEWSRAAAPPGGGAGRGQTHAADPGGQSSAAAKGAESLPDWLISQKPSSSTEHLSVVVVWSRRSRRPGATPSAWRRWRTPRPGAAWLCRGRCWRRWRNTETRLESKRVRLTRTGDWKPFHSEHQFSTDSDLVLGEFFHQISELRSTSCFRLIEDLEQQKQSLSLQVEELQVKVHDLSSSLENRERDAQVFFRVYFMHIFI